MIFTQEFLSHQIASTLQEQAKEAFSGILQDCALGQRPALNLATQPEKIQEFEAVASYFREKFETVVVFGTGGSSLGGQALVALAQDSFGFQKKGPRLIFMDNIDPDTFARFFASTNFKTTGFIVISKSGHTAETLCQMLCVLDTWPKDINMSDHFLLITEEKDSPLTGLAKSYKIPTLPHDPLIGGRFAALSLVGLLPAMIAGLDPHMILLGAKDTLHQNNEEPINGSAWTMAIHRDNINISVMMPYCDRLQLFCKWYRQLWAES